MVRFSSISTAIILCFLVLSFPVSAAEVYVYVSTASGSDVPASGSMGSPYASIGYAVAQNPGTVSDPVTIRVEAGTYTENLSLSGDQSLLGGYSTGFAERNVEALYYPPNATIIDGGNVDSVINLSGYEDTTREISGFTIRNGNSAGGGGGIYGNESMATIRYNLIYGNYASGTGGGINLCDGVMEWNFIYDNTSGGSGGGVGDSYSDMSNCYIYDNFAIIDGGGVALHSNDTISNCYIYNNTASGDGGGISGGSSNIVNCSIYDNDAGGVGGGIYNCSGEIRGSRIYGNTATSSGGGLNLCSGAINNCWIYDNYAGLDGGGLYDCDGNLFNNTIYGNEAFDDGGGIYGCDGGLANCILWANVAGDSGPQGSTSSAPGYCCIQDLPAPGGGNFGTDPGLVRPDLGQFHLAVGSACINAGADTGLAVDIDGGPRPVGGTFDVGADEYDGIDSSAPVFDHFLRSVPREGAVYLEWDDAFDFGEPISYLLYEMTVSGSHSFISPKGSTLDTSMELALPSGPIPHYVVPRAEDCFGNETSNTDEYAFIPAANMISDINYNADFEFFIPIRSDGAAPPTPPEGWSASNQDYGSKTSYIGATTLDSYEGSRSARIDTFGTPVFDDLSIASLVSDLSVALEKDHTYAVSAAVRRNDSQWARFILFSSGFSIIHTESIDALDDQNGDSGWEILYFHFRAPSNINAYVRIDSMVANRRTAGGRHCIMWVDDVQIVDLGIETYTDIYNVTPPPPQYGIRNQYFGLGTETEISTIGGTAYTSAEMPKRWNISMAVDSGSNDAAGYPLWGQEMPQGLADTSGAAGFVKAKAADVSGPAWPAISADGANINSSTSNGYRHVLSFNYGAAGTTRPLLRAFMINNNFSHYSSLFIDPSVGIPGNRMWPLTLHFSPYFGKDIVLVRFDNVTLGAGGGGTHTDETTVYVDNVFVGTVD